MGRLTNTAGPVSYSLVDKAFDCTAGNGNIYTGTLTPDIGSDPICSMSAWFKTTNADTTDIQSIMHIGDTSARTLINIQVRQNRLVTGMSINTNHVNDEGVATGQIIESNRWYHVVGVKSGTGALTSSNIIFKLYLDGEEVGTPSLSNHLQTLQRRPRTLGGPKETVQLGPNRAVHGHQRHGRRDRESP